HFIFSSVKRFPSVKYPNRMLVLSGHGSGAIGDFLTDDHAKLGQPRSLTIPRLRDSFKQARTDLIGLGAIGKDEPLIQVLGMDSCLMSMAEVAYEVQDHVSFLVASEGFVPNAGWPYKLLLENLRTRIEDATKTGDLQHLSPESISSCIVK